MESSVAKGDGKRPTIRDTFAVERREQVRRIVNERGRVRTTELAQMFDVTEPTIRKDINELEQQGQLTRAHGGAVARASMAEVDITARETKYLDEKRDIARACMGLIRDGDSIFLDGGTTQYELARLMAEAAAGNGLGRGVKILTNSFKIGEICQSMPEPPIILGGRYRPSGGCFVGAVTMSTLRQFRLDLSFVGVTGVTEDGLYAADLAEAQIKTELIGRTQRTIIPMDHSKIGLSDFITVSNLRDVETIVTDRHDEQLAEWLDASGVELVVANSELLQSDSTTPLASRAS